MSPYEIFALKRGSGGVQRAHKYACALATKMGTSWPLGHAHLGSMPFDPSKQSIVVSRELSDELARLLDPRVHILLSQEERCMRDEGPFRICLPFGNRPSTLGVAQKAFQLARCMGAHIVLTHTTWRNPEMTDEDPLKHMDDQALEILVKLRWMADKMEVPIQEELAMADDIVRFVVRTAVLRECHLIVMSPDPRHLFGGHVRGVLRQSNIPLLIMGQEQGVAQ